MVYLRSLVLAVIAFLGIGCAQGRPFQAINPPPGLATVYVYRLTTGYVGSGVNLTVKCDGEPFGQVNNDGYVWRFVSAGRHTISSETESKSEITYDFVPGKFYYIEATVHLGFWIGQPRLVMVPEEQGKLAILSTKFYGPEERYIPPPPITGYGQGIPPAR